MFFCEEHLYLNEKCIQLCERCLNDKEVFNIKPEHPDFINFILTDDSWEQWRQDNSDTIKTYKMIEGIELI